MKVWLLQDLEGKAVLHEYCGNDPAVLLQSFGRAEHPLLRVRGWVYVQCTVLDDQLKSGVTSRKFNRVLGLTTHAKHRLAQTGAVSGGTAAVKRKTKSETKSYVLCLRSMLSSQLSILSGLSCKARAQQGAVHKQDSLHAQWGWDQPSTVPLEPVKFLRSAPPAVLSGRQFCNKVLKAARPRQPNPKDRAVPCAVTCQSLPAPASVSVGW